MIRIKEIRNVIVKGLYDHLGLIPIPTKDVKPKEPYPYITYNFISPYTQQRGQGNITTTLEPSLDNRFEYDVVERLDLQPTMTLSINTYSNNRADNGYDGKSEALELAHKAMAWFKFIGYQFLDDSNLVCVDVEAFGDRSLLIVDEYEFRIGFDVIIRFTDGLKRRYETIESINIGKDIY